MKKLFVILILVTLACMALSSCRDTDGPSEVNPRVYDIVCLRSMTNSGSTFTLTKPNSDQIITYTASAHIDTVKVPVGDRLLLAYSPVAGRPYISGPVTAYGYSQISNDVLRGGVIDSIPDWNRDPVYLLSAWMSEDFLNIRARLTFDDRPRRCFVMLDTLTTRLSRPVCYLVHQLAEPIENFERAYYLSVDMSALKRRLPHCEGFELRLNDSNLHRDTLFFDIK